MQIKCSRCDGKGFITYQGDVLRLRREKAGLSLRELARRGGVSTAWLSDVELNRRKLTPRGQTIYDRWCK